ncbi:MAG: pyridoxal phosphate-dependent aminotransferase, partial [Bacteroidota bacterium]
MIHGHGDDAYKYNKPLVADFSSNVWFEGPSSDLLKHLQEQLHNVDHYPEPGGETLQRKIADFHKLEPKNCLVANGSVEAFYLIALAYRENKSSIVTPCFSEYEDACQIHSHDLQFVKNTDQWEKQVSGKQLVWFGNPNNPDGKVIQPDVLERLLKEHPETVFVVDEAYGELCAEFQSAASLIPAYRNLLIVRSFTKSFAIPGLRLGYVLGGESLIEKLRELKMPWTVNSLALEAGRFIMDHYDELMPDKNKVKTASEAFQRQLKALEDSLTIVPSQCNYCLIKLNG